uniref:Uncharacterized protein n=1 Tax=Rhizophora mucronata TaxID=61149 RepID=A0A2P2QQW7_RHIMU
MCQAQIHNTKIHSKPIKIYFRCQETIQPQSLNY